MKNTVSFGRMIGALAIPLVLGAGSSGVRAENGSMAENVLVILADDIGVDVLECYGEGSVFPPTPNINTLRDTGVLFRNVWSNPVCSPSRACLLTGRYAFRTGVGGCVMYVTGDGLPLSENLIPEVLDANSGLGYAHAAFGKWHLSSAVEGGYDGPNLAGFSHFSGMLYNADMNSYFDWDKTVNGVTSPTTNYATSENVDDAIAWINDRGDNPWFVYLAFNAAHGPLHDPPDDLHSYDELETMLDRYGAMIEAMDTEMGRLLASFPPGVLERTNIIFLADNGTAGDLTQPPFDPDHAKHTLYEGGINVPLIISGPRVAEPGIESNVLVNVTDLFATVLEIMGIDLQASLPSEITVDSVSLLPLLQGETFVPRTFAFSDLFGSEGSEAVGRGDPSYPFGYAIRNPAGYKLIRFTPYDTEEFYDLSVDPFETTNLLTGELDPDQQANYDELSFLLDDLLKTPCEGDATGDGTVDPLDAGFVLSRFGCPVNTGDPDCDAADGNADGAVDPLDVGFVQARFGVCE